MADWKFWKKTKKKAGGDEERKDLNKRVAVYTMTASGVNASPPGVNGKYGSAPGALNNNQRLATLSMLRDLKDDD